MACENELTNYNQALQLSQGSEALLVGANANRQMAETLFQAALTGYTNAAANERAAAAALIACLQAQGQQS